jgi:hypothetical protein
MKEVEVRRTLSVILNPNRYRSKAAEAFIKEVLPPFGTYPEAIMEEKNPTISGNPKEIMTS